MFAHLRQIRDDAQTSMSDVYGAQELRRSLCLCTRCHGSADRFNHSMERLTRQKPAHDKSPRAHGTG